MSENKHIGPLLRIIHTAMDQQINASVQGMELTSAQLFVLHYIIRNGDHDVYQKDIENYFELSHATVAGLIARLESKGFIVSIPTERDKRFKRLCATEKALCCDQQMRKNIEQIEQLTLYGFSAEEIQQRHLYLDRILRNLDADMDKKGGMRNMERRENRINHEVLC